MFCIVVALCILRDIFSSYVCLSMQILNLLFIACSIVEQFLALSFSQSTLEIGFLELLITPIQAEINRYFLDLFY